MLTRNLLMAAQDQSVAVASGNGDPNWSNVSLLLTGDDLVDHSSIAKTVTNVGSVSVDTTTKKYGSGSLKFNSTSTGDGNLLSVPSNSIGALLQSFTIELWAYPSTTKSSHNDGVISYGNTFSNFGIAYGDKNGGNFTLRSTTNIGDTTTYPQNTWHHLAITRDSSNVMSFFINGVLQGSYTDNRAFSSSEFIIGSYGNPQSYPFGGYIDDLRITNGVARYTSNFTPPTSALPIGGGNWSKSNDPIIAWETPNTASTINFAVPSNNLNGFWEYTNTATWITFANPVYVSVPGGVIFNGITYSGYTRTGNWSRGNPTYRQRVNSSIFGLITTNENTALGNSIFTGPF